MTSELAFVTQIALGLVFLRSAVGKLSSYRHFVQGVSDYELVHASLVRPAAGLLVAVELFLGVAHALGVLLPWAIAIGIAFLALLEAAVVVTLRKGLRVQCMCFGVRDGEPMSVTTAVRLALLMGAEILLWTQASPGAVRPIYS